MQLKSLHIYTQQEKVGKKQNLRCDKNTIPRMREGNCSLEMQFIDILVQVRLIVNSVWEVVFYPYLILELGQKWTPSNAFFSNHKFHFNETLHKITCHLENTKNVEIWTLVTHMIIGMTSSLIRNKLVFLKSNYYLKNKSQFKESLH